MAARSPLDTVLDCKDTINLKAIHNVDACIFACATTVLDCKDTINLKAIHNYFVS